MSVKILSDSICIHEFNSEVELEAIVGIVNSVRLSNDSFWHSINSDVLYELNRSLCNHLYGDKIEQRSLEVEGFENPQIKHFLSEMKKVKSRVDIKRCSRKDKRRIVRNAFFPYVVSDGFIDKLIEKAFR